MGLCAEGVFLCVLRQERSERPNRIISCKIRYLIFKSLLGKMMLFVTAVLFRWEYCLWMSFLRIKSFLF